jgi:hypothetical protein
MVVRADGRGELPLVIDSRTVVPPDLASGASVRVDYRTLRDGRNHAERVLPYRPEAATDSEPAGPGASYSDIEHWNPLAVAGGILLSLVVLLARSWRPRERVPRKIRSCPGENHRRASGWQVTRVATGCVRSTRCRAHVARRATGACPARQPSWRSCSAVGGRLAVADAVIER